MTNKLNDGAGRVVVHIGLPRTASTFLQKRIFSEIPSDSFYYNPPDVTELTKELLYVNANRNLVALKSKLGNALSNYDNGTVLLSEETYSMIPWTQNRLDNHKNIKAVIPDAKIIIGIRYQTDFIVSLYRLCFQKNIFQPIQKYLAYYDGKFHSVSAKEKEKIESDEYNTRKIYRLLSFPPLDVFEIKFPDLIDDYVAAFGKKNVYVYFYEKFSEDPEGQLRAMMEFIGVDYLPKMTYRITEKVNKSRPPLFCVLTGFLYNYRNIYYRSHLMKWAEVKRKGNVTLLIEQMFLKAYRYFLDRIALKTLETLCRVFRLEVDLLEKDGMREKLDKMFREDNKKLLEHFPDSEIPRIYLAQRLDIS